ncbi:MAG: hypothetical protein AB1644_01440 [Candidatus Zixiibacteriota bacterium]
MSDSRLENRLFLRIFSGAVILVALLAAGFLLVGPSLIKTYHEGGSFGIFPPDPNPDKGTLEEYGHKIGVRFWSNIVAGIPLSLLIIFLLYKVYKQLLGSVKPWTKPDFLLGQTDVTLGPVWAVTIYALLTLVYFYPSLKSISTAMIGPPGDNMACLWTLGYAGKHLFADGINYVTDLFYPEGSSFYFHAWSFYNLFLFKALSGIFGSVTSYNLLILHSFPVAGVAAFLLIRYLTDNSWMALLGGFLFAFNPAHFERAQHHMNIATIQFLPLFVLYYIRSVRERSWRPLIAAAAALLLNALADWNYLLFGLWFMLFAYVYLAIRRRRLWLWDVVWKSGSLIVLTLLVVSPWLIPMIRLAVSGPGVGAGGHNQFVVDLLGLVAPNPHHLLGGVPLFEYLNNTYTGVLTESVGYLGLVALALVLFAGRKLLVNTAKYLLGAVTFLLMSFGAQPHFAGYAAPVLVPGRLVPMLPLLSNSRAPGRNIVFVYLFWSIIVSMAVGYVWRSIKNGRMRTTIVVALVALLAVDYFSLSRDATSVLLPPCYTTLPRDGTRYGLLDLPGGYVQTDRYMMYQGLHGIPIVQGWVSRKPNRTLIDTLDLVDLEHQREQLVSAGVRYIVVHKMYLPDSTLNVDLYRATYRITYEDSANIVLRVD